MRYRSVLLLIAAALVPASSASADHCNDITVYSYVPVATTGVSWDPASWVGCAVPEHTNSDLIVPGSTGTQTFFSSSSRPLDGYYDENGELRGSYIDVDGSVALLSFTRGTNAQGAPANFWFTQHVPHTTEQSISPGFLVQAHVCLDIDLCESRTYRSATTA